MAHQVLLCRIVRAAFKCSNLNTLVKRFIVAIRNFFLVSLSPFRLVWVTLWQSLWQCLEHCRTLCFCIYFTWYTCLRSGPRCDPHIVLETNLKLVSPLIFSFQHMGCKLRLKNASAGLSVTDQRRARYTSIWRGLYPLARTRWSRRPSEDSKCGTGREKHWGTLTDQVYNHRSSFIPK